MPGLVGVFGGNESLLAIRGAGGAWGAASAGRAQLPVAAAIAERGEVSSHAGRVSSFGCRSSAGRGNSCGMALGLDRGARGAMIA